MTGRFHTLYQNKGYDIAVKVVTALCKKKKKKLHANLSLDTKVALHIDINTNLKFCNRTSNKCNRTMQI